jgi:hypothetical protein
MPSDTPHAYGWHGVQPPATPPVTPRAPLVEREPALVAGGVGTALVSAFVGLLASFGKLNVQQSSALEAFGYALVMAAPVLVAWWTRGRVFSPATLEKAGLTPEHVEAVAEDPCRSFTEAPLVHNAGQHGPRGVD